MKYTIISGSHREESQSERISKWIQKEAELKGDSASTISLAGNPFPLWSEDAWKSDSDLTAQMKEPLAKISESDALIIVSPEWGGMVPAGLKNFLLFLSQRTAGHKPVLLVSVSASRGGSYPIAELRISGYKNNKMCFIPDHLIVRNCKDALPYNSDQAEFSSEDYISRRALYSLSVLDKYARAMQDLKNDKSLVVDEFKYGM